MLQDDVDKNGCWSALVKTWSRVWEGYHLLGGDKFLRYALPLRNYYQNNPESL